MASSSERVPFVDGSGNDVTCVMLASILEFDEGTVGLQAASPKAFPTNIETIKNRNVNHEIHRLFFILVYLSLNLVKQKLIPPRGEFLIMQKSHFE
jgi:hypothetical protein